MRNIQARICGCESLKVFLGIPILAELTRYRSKRRQSQTIYRIDGKDFLINADCIFTASHFCEHVSAELKRVWILGAGFSRPLGGPLIGDLLAYREQPLLRAALPKDAGPPHGETS